jgi:hypothetical protein
LRTMLRRIAATAGFRVLFLCHGGAFTNVSKIWVVVKWIRSLHPKCENLTRVDNNIRRT